MNLEEPRSHETARKGRLSRARGSGQTHWFKGKASGPGSVMLQGHMQETWIPWARTFWEKIGVQKDED